MKSADWLFFVQMYYIILLFDSFFSSQPPNNEFFYEAAGDEKATEYFEVDAESGDIFVKKSLLTDSELTKNYRVRIICTTN